VQHASHFRVDLRENTVVMIETIIIALLLWLWVIERRLNGLGDSVRALQLDVNGLRAQGSRTDSAAAATPRPAEASESPVFTGTLATR
jgi:hypothetical protein